MARMSAQSRLKPAKLGDQKIQRGHGGETHQVQAGETRP